MVGACDFAGVVSEAGEQTKMRREFPRLYEIERETKAPDRRKLPSFSIPAPGFGFGWERDMLTTYRLAEAEVTQAVNMRVAISGQDSLS